MAMATPEKKTSSSKERLLSDSEGKDTAAPESASPSIEGSPSGTVEGPPLDPGLPLSIESDKKADGKPRQELGYEDGCVPRKGCPLHPEVDAIREEFWTKYTPANLRLLLLEDQNARVRNILFCATALMFTVPVGVM